MVEFDECPICGKKFEAIGYGKTRKKYCSKECRYRAIYNRKKEKRSIERKCAYCGKIFKGNKKQKYCSIKCQKQATWERRKGKETVERKCEYCGRRFIGNEKRKYCSDECYRKAISEKLKERRTFERKCEYCGKLFNGNIKQKYCSKECQKKAHREQMNRRNSWRWYNDKEYRKMKQLKYRDGLGTIKFPENIDEDWEKEILIIRGLKKKAGLN